MLQRILLLTSVSFVLTLAAHAGAGSVTLEVSDQGTDTHVPVRVYVTPPVKMEDL